MSNHRIFAVVLALFPLLLLAGCATPEEPSRLSIEYESYTLENGLDVVLHVDRSDPIAAVAMTFHVGSAREVHGRTGFAHLFEHLFFLDSENLGQGGLDRLMTKVGSSANGSTSRDWTNYFEVVPNDGLQKALWAESDKLGFFINTVTDSVLAKEKQVVKNEKRQGVDNQPYGHVSSVVDRALYPDGHPYSWQVIGSLSDLDDATLDDVKEFHRRWYGPNNATLVVAGDIDTAETKAWIEKYFVEIPSVETPRTEKPAPVSLTETRRYFHEDNFAKLPQLNMAWPTVPIYHPDSYALDLLADLLSDGKKAPLYRVLVQDEKLAPEVRMFNRSQELAGRMTLQARAFPDKKLDEVYAAVKRAFTLFETEGVSEQDLARVKAGYETSFLSGLSSVIGKAFQLAQYSILAGSAGFVEEDIRNALAVTESDVMRVYDLYIKGTPFVATSFVPKGRQELALENSQRAEVVEEEIVQGAEAAFVVGERGDIPKTPSRIDRSIEPPFGPSPTLSAPDVWTSSLPNGLRVLGIEDSEVPLVQFELRFKGGLLLEEKDRVGVSSLLARTLTEGTAQRTAEELEAAIDELGSDIRLSSGRESFTLRGTSLARNYAATMAIVEEILLEPRWDSEKFELARQRAANQLRQRSASPFSISDDAFNRLLYGDHILGSNPRGTVDSLESMRIEDLEEYYKRALVPGLATFLSAGSISQEEVLASLQGISRRWTGDSPSFPDPPRGGGGAGLFFVDVPGAKQSVVRIGFLALPETHPDFYPATVMNFRLGGGGFASDLVQVLREQKGFTYGIGSGFQGTDLAGSFQITSPIRSNATFEALELIKQIMQAHGPEFDETDLEATQGFLLRNNARSFETLSAKLRILARMSSLGFPADYILQREKIVREMTVARVSELAEKYLDPRAMIWLVVGDAETQMKRLKALGLGAPTLVDRQGKTQ